MTKKIPKTALWLLGFLLFLSVFRDVLANGRPLYCRIGGHSYWPGLRTVLVPELDFYSDSVLLRLQQQVNAYDVWKNPANFDEPPVYAPIPFSPGEHSSLHVGGLARPGTVHQGLNSRFVHWLGTDAEGRDIAATLVAGARTAMLTGALAMGVALSIGLGLGLIAGFFADERLFIRRGVLLSLLLGFPLAWFWGISVRQYTLSQSSSAEDMLISVSIFVGVLAAFAVIGRFLSKMRPFSAKIWIPADLLVMRLAEIFSSIPRLILVVVLTVALRSMFSQSIWLMIALIGAFSWMGVARLTRAELLRIRTLDYMSAARGLGLPDWRIMLRHALPNAIRPVYVAFAFGTANAILLEAYLSFLGFGGRSARGTSWGSLFYNESGASNPLESWWVTLFPGLMIFITVFSLNRIGEAFSDRP